MPGGGVGLGGLEKHQRKIGVRLREGAGPARPPAQNPRARAFRSPALFRASPSALCAIAERGISLTASFNCAMASGMLPSSARMLPRNSRASPSRGLRRDDLAGHASGLLCDFLCASRSQAESSGVRCASRTAHGKEGQKSPHSGNPNFWVRVIPDPSLK